MQTNTCSSRRFRASTEQAWNSARGAWRKRAWLELSTEDRLLVVTLSVFADAFDVAAAAAVHGVPADNMTGLIGPLLDARVVLPLEADRRHVLFAVRSELRFWALEAPEYAALVKIARDRHAQYFLFHQHGSQQPTVAEAGLTSFEEANVEAAAQHVGAVIASLRRSGAEPALANLTARQREVAQLVCAAMTNQQIANALGIANWTVVNHVRAIMRKLGCSSRVELARRMLGHPRLNGPPLGRNSSARSRR